MIMNFSSRHKLHVLVMDEYALDRLMISHFIVNLVLVTLSDLYYVFLVFFVVNRARVVSESCLEGPFSGLIGCLQSLLLLCIQFLLFKRTR